MAADVSVILALDVGDRRIGVARARTDVKIAQPLTTLEVSADVNDQLAALCQQEAASLLVVGLPRGLDGQETGQTRKVQAFVEQLQVGLPVQFQDEAVTSAKAEQELNARGKPYDKADIDALAATYILEDYIKTI
jgi:putative Holliday junction resolvase